jgi:hypothetical protein
MLAFSQYFYLVHAGQGRWLIRHQITDELAGTILRAEKGFALYNDGSELVGTFDSIDIALADLYAAV